MARPFRFFLLRFLGGAGVAGLVSKIKTRKFHFPLLQGFPFLASVADHKISKVNPHGLKVFYPSGRSLESVLEGRFGAKYRNIIIALLRFPGAFAPLNDLPPLSGRSPGTGVQGG